MKLKGMLVLVLLLSAGPVFGQKIFIDYDEDYNSSQIRTFA